MRRPGLWWISVAMVCAVRAAARAGTREAAYRLRRRSPAERLAARVSQVGTFSHGAGNWPSCRVGIQNLPAGGLNTEYRNHKQTVFVSSYQTGGAIVPPGDAPLGLQIRVVCAFFIWAFAEAPLGFAVQLSRPRLRGALTACGLELARFLGQSVGQVLVLILVLC